jgi:hypothetical protein
VVAGAVEVTAVILYLVQSLLLVVAMVLFIHRHILLALAVLVVVALTKRREVLVHQDKVITAA